MGLYKFCELCEKIIPVVYRTMILGGFLFALQDLIVWKLSGSPDKDDEENKKKKDDD